MDDSYMCVIETILTLPEFKSENAMSLSCAVQINVNNEIEIKTKIVYLCDNYWI